MIFVILAYLLEHFVLQITLQSMPTVPAQSVPEVESQVPSKEDELLDLPDVPSGVKDISTSSERKTKGFSLTSLKNLHM